ncbi:MAG: PRC-barrel domain-containing protein [Bacillota bacterium]|nr:PRC-barrel domain-containing protein [Bacillota bacterium]
MRTFSSLKGLHVYETNSGKIVGEVIDVYITDKGNIKGLLVKNGAFFKQSFFLDFHDVTSFGLEAIMIEDGKSLIKADHSHDYTFLHHNSLHEKKVLSKDGDTFGLLNDVFFMEELGTIVGYECTDGFFSDITEGKKTIHSVNPPAIGKDAIIVDVNTM